MGGDNIGPWEVCIQVSADSLHRTSDVSPSGVAVPDADGPGGQRIHETGGGRLSKQVSAITTGTGDHIRDAEEATAPRSQ